MYILGFNGSKRTRADSTYRDSRIDFFTNNAAAVLLKDGIVVAGLEEERSDRLKNSYKFPAGSIRFCLKSEGIGLSDIDAFAFYVMEDAVRTVLEEEDLLMSAQGYRDRITTDPRELLSSLFEYEIGEAVPREKLHFVRHHEAHAMSAWAFSGFDRALVLTIDGQGETESGQVALARKGKELEVLRSFSLPQSLGDFYVGVIRYLGYYYGDEYKIMGLAPYGDPARFRAAFRELYELKSDGDYELDTAPRLHHLLVPRRKGESFDQLHQDVAAALQESLETITMHVLKHYQAATGERNLCMAGGVALNCTMNGKIMASGLFDDLYITPAPHDAGTSLGAAMTVYVRSAPQASRKSSRLRSVYWGTDIGDEKEVFEALEPWSSLISIERPASIVEETAALIADQKVIGWVQGRSEFGPRALGNRSILADPRPVSNKDRVNAMVKKREGYRPFAPSVLLEHAHKYFEFPEGWELPFMLFVIPVREEFRESLGAITHIDGTARVQTVTRELNARYWELIEAFRKLTDIPLLLNTSFNNNAEPIVDSIHDAITSYLTTGIDYLVVGDFLIKKNEDLQESNVAQLVPELPWYVVLQDRRCLPDAKEYRRQSFVDERGAGLFMRGRGKLDYELSSDEYEFLCKVDSRHTLEQLLKASGHHGKSSGQKITQTVVELWERRLIRLLPSQKR